MCREREREKGKACCFEVSHYTSAFFREVHLLITCCVSLLVNRRQAKRAGENARGSESRKRGSGERLVREFRNNAFHRQHSLVARRGIIIIPASRSIINTRPKSHTHICIYSSVRRTRGKQGNTLASSPIAFVPSIKLIFRGGRSATDAIVGTNNACNAISK